MNRETRWVTGNQRFSLGSRRFLTRMVTRRLLLRLASPSTTPRFVSMFLLSPKIRTQKLLMYTLKHAYLKDREKYIYSNYIYIYICISFRSKSIRSLKRRRLSFNLKFLKYTRNRQQKSRLDYIYSPGTTGNKLKRIWWHIWKKEKKRANL